LHGMSSKRAIKAVISLLMACTAPPTQSSKSTRQAVCVSVLAQQHSARGSRARMQNQIPRHLQVDGLCSIVDTTIKMYAEIIKARNSGCDLCVRSNSSAIQAIISVMIICTDSQMQALKHRKQQHSARKQNRISQLLRLVHSTLKTIIVLDCRNKRCYIERIGLVPVTIWQIEFAAV
jgi:mevalonate kinase